MGHGETHENAVVYLWKATACGIHLCRDRLDGWYLCSTYNGY